MTSVTYQSAMQAGHRSAWALKWDVAVIHYRQAVAERPDDVAARTSLATALYRLSRFDEAMAEYRALLQLVPDDEGTLVRLAEIEQRRGVSAEIAEAHLRLAECYLRKGRREQAIQTWVKLSELLPNELELQELLYRSVSKAGETRLAGRLGLNITRLRGELDSKQLRNPSTYLTAPTDNGGPNRSEGVQRAEAVAKATQHMLDAQAFVEAGSMHEALLCYAEATARLEKAGAAEQIAEVERSAATLVGRFGGLRLRDLAGLDGDRRGAAVQQMLAIGDALQSGKIHGAVDDCFAAICSVPEYLPFQITLAEAQERQGELEAAATRYLSIAEVYVIRCDFTAALAMVDRAAELSFVSAQVREGLVERFLVAGGISEAKDQMLVLADGLAKDGSWREATAVLERAVLLAPKDASALTRLGAALVVAGKHAAAVEAYRGALSSGSLQESLRLEVARRLSIAASLADSLADVEGVLPIVLQAADGGHLAGDALADYTGALSEHPECVGLRYCYGAIMAHLSRRSEAIANLGRALNADARIAAPAHLMLARLWLDDDIDQAAEHLRKATILVEELGEHDAQRVSDLKRVAAAVLERLGDLDQTVLALDDVKRLVPDDRQVYAKLAELHFRRGDLRRANAELLALGDLHARGGEHDQALGVYSAAAQLDVSSVEIKGKLSEAYRLMGRTTEALSLMDEMATVLASRGEAGRAVDVLRDMIELRRQSDPAEALSLRKRVASLMPESFDARKELARAYLATGRSDAALSEAYNLWQDMFTAGRWREAAGALEQILLIDPWNAEALVHLGEVAEKLGERTRAMEHYRRAQANDPGNSQASSHLTRLAAE